MQPQKQDIHILQRFEKHTFHVCQPNAKVEIIKKRSRNNVKYRSIPKGGRKRSPHHGNNRP